MKLVFNSDIDSSNYTSSECFVVSNVAFTGLQYRTDPANNNSGIITPTFNVSIFANDCIQVLSLGFILFQDPTDNVKKLNELIIKLPEIGISRYKDSVIREISMTKFRTVDNKYYTITCTDFDLAFNRNQYIMISAVLQDILDINIDAYYTNYDKYLLMNFEFNYTSYNVLFATSKVNISDIVVPKDYKRHKESRCYMKIVIHKENKLTHALWIPILIDKKSLISGIKKLKIFHRYSSDYHTFEIRLLEKGETLALESLVHIVYDKVDPKTNNHVCKEYATIIANYLKNGILYTINMDILLPEYQNLMNSLNDVLMNGL